MEQSEAFGGGSRKEGGEGHRALSPKNTNKPDQDTLIKQSVKYSNRAITACNTIKNPPQWLSTLQKWYLQHHLISIVAQCKDCALIS